MLLFTLPASFLCWLSVHRLRRWEGGKEVKEIPQRETENKQVGASSQKRSCAVCLWNRWLNYSLTSHYTFIFLSEQHDLSSVLSLIVLFTDTLVLIFPLFGMSIDLMSTYQTPENTFNQNHLVRKCMKQNTYLCAYVTKRRRCSSCFKYLFIYHFWKVWKVVTLKGCTLFCHIFSYHKSQSLLFLLSLLYRVHL